MPDSVPPNFVMIAADQLRTDAVGVRQHDRQDTEHRRARRAEHEVHERVREAHGVLAEQGFVPDRRYPHVRGHRGLTHLLRPTDPNLLKPLEEHDHPECVDKVVAVRSRDRTYVWRMHEPPELYDRQDDPTSCTTSPGWPSTPTTRRNCARS